ncbi:ATP-binding protein [Thermithiobacillus tepidarius DSM 3134]|uniref:sensor histidine kinase n=1 Tax=Thermithiobacillus tepidarius TaxID=929 RepID=UPI0004100BEE|nr:ATP-binding protein [Thermithiobacillus tepidarius]
MEERRTAPVSRLSTLGVGRLGGGFASGWGVVILLLALGASLTFTYIASQGRDYGDLFIPLLIGNGAAVVLLFALILFNIFVLWRQWRAGILGTRLAARLVLIIAVLTVTPAAAVFGFSWLFLNRGIDSWFSVEVRDALDQALSVARSSIEQSRLDTLGAAQSIARALEEQGEDKPLATLMRMRAQFRLAEATLLEEDGRIIGTSSDSLTLAPALPTGDMLAVARGSRPYAVVEPNARGDLVIKVLVPVASTRLAPPRRLLYVVNPLPRQLTAAADSVQLAYKRYQRLELMRDPMKTAFKLSLTSVLLVTGLTALWLSLFLSRRLAAPIGHLAAGTRAVARGEFAPVLPGAGHDEMGILVHSFNSMTRQLAQAQRSAAQAQAQAEERRAFVETILAHLSTGVMTFNAEGRLAVINAAAAHILRIPFDEELGLSAAELIARHPELSPFFGWLQNCLAHPERDCQQELVLDRVLGKQTLLLRGAPLPPARPVEEQESAPAVHGPAGFVLVFDDITTLIQAQRSAAWSEVARRLAHEIKNPLTPIQLSAERLRRKYLAQLGAAGEPLDRATRTIINQVETLKVMVDAFSEYARQPQLRIRPLDLNALINETLELYREQGQHLITPASLPIAGDAAAKGIYIETDLDPTLPLVEADAGRLRQVLHNLLRNALDALSEGHRIEIRTRAQGGGNGELRVQLTVADDGPGFPPELLERVFEPYVTSKPRGTGLGLAIVKKMVEEHGGQITADNRPTGGARIVITLPARILHKGVA